jgi:hypothetical protein
MKQVDPLASNVPSGAEPHFDWLLPTGVGGHLTATKVGSDQQWSSGARVDVARPSGVSAEGGVLELHNSALSGGVEVKLPSPPGA